MGFGERGCDSESTQPDGGGGGLATGPEGVTLGFHVFGEVTVDPVEAIDDLLWLLEVVVVAVA